MHIIPAIDIKDGHCVRLKQGEMQSATVFSEDPAAMAQHWLELGAQRAAPGRPERRGRGQVRGTSWRSGRSSA